MLRLRALLVLFALLLPPASGAASPLRHSPGAVLDWPRPLFHIVPVSVRGLRHALPRVRLFTMEVAILPWAGSSSARS